MIDIKLATDQDQPSWDSYVREHTDASPYHLQAWLRTIEDAYGHKGYCLMANQGGRVVGVLPLILMRPPFCLPSKLCSLPFCDVGGCLCNNSQIKAALMDAAFELSREVKATSFEVRESTNSNRPCMQQNNNEQGKKFRMVMPLPDSSDELWNSFKSKLRSQVRKAEKNGLTSTIGRGDEYIDAFYNVFSQNMRDLGSPVHSRRLFESIRKYYAQDMLISLVKMGDKVVGAGLVLVFEKIATIPWASTKSEYNKYAPNMLLYWTILKHATDCGCNRFDLGRSTYNEGTYRFKLQWGADPLPLEWLSYNPSGAELDVQSKISNLRPILEKIWQKLPLFIANSLGPFARKHISL